MPITLIMCINMSTGLYVIFLIGATQLEIVGAQAGDDLWGSTVTPNPELEGFSPRPGWRGEVDKQRLRYMLQVEEYLREHVLALVERVDQLEQDSKSARFIIITYSRLIVG